jgi:hypothetical protein
MAWARLKGRNGGAVIVNTNNVIYVDGMNTEAGPLLGYSALLCHFGVSVCVKGTPEEVQGALMKAEGGSLIETAV